MEAVVTIHGGMGREHRIAVQESFRHDPHVQILLATDAAGEGINLQRAHLMVNYDLPWNPNRLEQRNGRIDRFGQPKEKVVIRTLVMNDTLEADILRVLVEKAKRIREDYGFSPPYFDDETSIIQLIQEHKPQYKYGPRQTTLDEFMKGRKRNEDQIITVKLGENFVLVETQIDFRAEIGDKIWMVFDVHKMNIFDKESTLNLI